MNIPNTLYKFLTRKLSYCLLDTLVESDFNTLFMYFEKLNKLYRIIPMGVFSNRDGILDRLSETPQGVVFRHFLDSSTSNLQDARSKGRKLSRMISSFHKEYGDILPYSMGAHQVFLSVVVSLAYLPGGEEYYASAPIKLGLPDSVVESVSSYISLLFHLSIIQVESEEFADIMNVFVESERKDWIRNVLMCAEESIKSKMSG